MTSIISTAVLRAAVLSAFDRGRYKVHFGTAPAGDDIAVVPASICLDLGERDDDLMFFEKNGIITAEERLEIADFIEQHGADDHGPAVPAQDGPRVYEFAFQDAVPHYGFFPAELIDVTQNHAPDYVAASNADWVHVYDRVTRERRTLKRPGADRIVKGLADVAADLRRPNTASGTAPTDNSLINAPVVAIHTPSAPGPLTSAEGLLRGDVLRCIRGVDEIAEGQIVRVQQMHEWPGGHKEAIIDGLCWRHDRFAFVGRPDADGWMDWPGGENPVPGQSVFTLTLDCRPVQNASEDLDWRADFSNPIRRFRLVDLPALPYDT